jgi:hypothetical protein
MIRTIKINNTDVWLYIQRLTVYEKINGLMQLNEKEEYLCYIKLSPPTEIIFGELIRDEQKKPKLFSTPEEAEIYAIKFFSSTIKK